MTRDDSLVAALGDYADQTADLEASMSALRDLEDQEASFDASKPALGVAAVMSALPVLIPIVILLMRRLGRSEVQL